jgi:hypothetical protein
VAAQKWLLQVQHAAAFFQAGAFAALKGDGVLEKRRGFFYDRGCLTLEYAEP